MKRNYLMGTALLSLLITGCGNQGSTSSEDVVSSGSSFVSSIDSSDSSIITSNSSISSVESSSSVSSSVDVSYPKIENGYVVYINFDGFAKYYYDEAVKNGGNGAPTLKSLMNEGVMFENLTNLTPSITNPMQNMIISGASSSKTKNVYRYFDVRNNVVVQQQRENAAATIYTEAVKNNLSVATVAHYLALTSLENNNPKKLYINADPTAQYGNHVARFDQAIKLAKRQQINNGGGVYVTVPTFPRLLTIYADDLDAIGHNESGHYGFSLANSEEERMQNVLTSLKSHDAKLKEFIDALKEAGIYDNVTFFLTTDHGMTGFGTSKRFFPSDSKYGKTKWPALRDKLKAINSSFIFEYLPAEGRPAASTTVVGVGGGLQMQLTFKSLQTESQLQAIANELMKEEYIEIVLTRQQLLDQGYWEGANVDLLVVPSERYHFHGISNVNGIYSVRGQHDTYLDSSRRVFGIAWGKYIKKLGTTNTPYNVVSFGSTMATILGIDLPDSNFAPLHDIIDYSLVK